MTMHEERGTLLKLQATASKLISVCTAAYNGNEELAKEIPNILAQLNDLYGKAGRNVEVDSDPQRLTDNTVNECVSHTDSRSYVSAISEPDASEAMPADELKKKQSNTVARYSNKKKRLKPGVKVVLATLFLTALIGAARLANANMNVAATSPEATLPDAEITPEPTIAPVETATPKPASFETPKASAEPEPEETAEPEPSETPETKEEGDKETVVRKEPLGTAGRLYFNDGWSVALNYADSNDTEAAQTLADAWDSACYMEASGKTMIADHATQGFDIILDCAEGTRATLVDADGKETRIICKATYKDAYWKDGFTHLPDGRGIWGASDGSIGMQTSTNSDGTEVFISYWDPVEE